MKEPIKWHFPWQVNYFKIIRWDLGMTRLKSEWRLLLSPEYLKDDLIAGCIVACVSLPLSLALALASGMPPASGLITAVITGMMCAIFGGTPLSVSGPSNAMPVILAAAVSELGPSGLLIVGLGCGLLQLLTGVFRLGNLIRFVPFPVVAGFTAGIGAIILIGQLPRALGLPPPDESHVIDVITHIHGLITQTQLPALALALGTLGINFVLPKFFPRLPAPLFAVLVPSLLVKLFGIDVPMIGAIPSSLPMPHFPTLPQVDISDIVSTVLAVYAVASLETLLSSASAEKFSKTSRTDPDQEMIGQGLGNLVTSLFGGLPGTGAIARTSLNIQAGAKTRRAAIFQSLIILLSIYCFSSVIGRIPLAVLAGVILSVALRMLHPRELIRLWKLSPSEGLVYLVTFLVIVFIDLIAGIRVGIVIALIIAALRLSQSQTQLQILNTHRFHELTIEGPLTFLSSVKMETVRSQLSQTDLSQGLVVNLSKVDTIDATGASQLIEVLEPIIKKEGKVVLLGLKPDCRKTLLSLDSNHVITKCIASSESEMMELLHDESNAGPLDRLIYGVEKFRQDIQNNYGSFFKKLAENQSPHTLFITCSDSRIDPNLITSTHPGELFIVRNVGNIIPPYGNASAPAEGAAVEFAVGVLNVKEVIVCGHSGCGAMKELLQGDLIRSKRADDFPSLKSWLQQAQSVKDQLPPGASIKQASELNALQQLENLKTYPLIRERLESGALRLHSWYYNIGDSELEEWDESRKLYVTIGSRETKSMEKRIEAGVQYQVPMLPPIHRDDDE